MPDLKTGAVAYFYANIKGFIESFISGILPGLPADIVIIIGAYWASKKYSSYKWLLDGLFYGALADLGTSGGLLPMLTSKARTPIPTAGVRW